MKIFTNAACELVPKHKVPVMLLRGAAGIALMSLSFTYMVSIPMLGWTMLAVSILLLKGCPACWGILLVNTMRGTSAARREADVRHEVDIAAEYERVVRSKRREYHPTDMADHLFPPEDVERFHRQAAAAAAEARQDDSSRRTAAAPAVLAAVDKETKND